MSRPAALISLLILTACATTPKPQGHQHSWDTTYVRGTGFNLKPNALLTWAVDQHTPGTALDVGMGQGRNTVFLATKGWAVTGVDPSKEGLRIAREAASAAKVSIDAVQGDIDDFDMGVAKYDLVLLSYVGGADLAERITKALRPGGLVVVEFFHKDMEKNFRHSMGAYDTGELEKLYPNFEVLRSEVVEDIADFGLQKDKLVRFVGRKK